MRRFSTALLACLIAATFATADDGSKEDACSAPSSLLSPKIQTPDRHNLICPIEDRAQAIEVRDLRSSEVRLTRSQLFHTSLGGPRIQIRPRKSETISQRGERGSFVDRMAQLLAEGLRLRNAKVQPAAD